MLLQVRLLPSHACRGSYLHIYLTFFIGSITLRLWWRPTCMPSCAGERQTTARFAVCRAKAAAKAAPLEGDITRSGDSGSPASTGRDSGEGNGSDGPDEQPGWEPACAGLLAGELDVSSGEAASWLDKAADKRRREAAGRLSGKIAQPPLVISLPEVTQLVGMLRDGTGLGSAGLTLLLRKWPRMLSHESAKLGASMAFLREELGLDAAGAAAALRVRVAGNNVVLRVF